MTIVSPTEPHDPALFSAGTKGARSICSLEREHVDGRHGPPVATRMRQVGSGRQALCDSHAADVDGLPAPAPEDAVAYDAVIDRDTARAAGAQRRLQARREAVSTRPLPQWAVERRMNGNKVRYHTTAITVEILLRTTTAGKQVRDLIAVADHHPNGRVRMDTADPAVLERMRDAFEAGAEQRAAAGKLRDYSRLLFAARVAATCLDTLHAAQARAAGRRATIS